MFTEKIGILPEEVLESLLNDRLVAKGTVLEVLTSIIREILKHWTIDELVVLLSKAKVAHRLLDFFPPGRQSEAAFEDHFRKAELLSVVRHSSRSDSARTCHVKLSRCYHPHGRSMQRPLTATMVAMKSLAMKSEWQ